MSFGLQKLSGIDDYERGPIPSPKPLDRFGFIKPKFNTILEGREKRRVRKWGKMIGIGGGDWKHYV
ncbi:hypothetical protein PVL29_010667 [Vitis rotundifolia]|uniref:Uncharacterized protein n=1 Tax=Vitis rotundifolia TaxID=103349 RepID=A0AA38ZUZ7_VITRO|nr:hypothetical protein PVL29_010667 [Vitis rotundifolia]